MGTGAGRLVGGEESQSLLARRRCEYRISEEDDVRKSSSRYIERIVEIRKEIELRWKAREKS